MEFLSLHALSFLIGSIPVGYLLARLRGVDIRSIGSGNTGATNVARALGKKSGLLTLIGDFAKGVVAVQLVRLLPNSSNVSAHQFVELASAFGFFAVLGHCYSPFLKGRGGKGVATGLGVFAALAPAETLVCCALFFAVFLRSRYVSLGSIVAAASMAPLIWIHGQIRGEQSPMLLLTAASIGLFIIMRHRANIERLLARTESKFGKAATL